MVKGEISRTLARTSGEKERKLTKLTITDACHVGYLNKVSQYQANYYEKKWSVLKYILYQNYPYPFGSLMKKKVFSSELILHKNDFITKTS